MLSHWIWCLNFHFSSISCCLIALTGLTLVLQTCCSSFHYSTFSSFSYFALQHKGCLWPLIMIMDLLRLKLITEEWAGKTDGGRFLSHPSSAETITIYCQTLHMRGIKHAGLVQSYLNTAKRHGVIRHTIIDFMTRSRCSGQGGHTEAESQGL